MERWDDTCSPAAQARRRSDHRHQLRPDDARRGGPPPSDDRPAQRRQLDPRDARGRPDHADRNPLGVALRPTVVVVGAGFGGLRAARALRKAPVDVVLVDRHNYPLFQPLLYQVATAGLEPEQIAKPVRAILRGQKNADFRLLEVTGLDLGRRELATGAGPVRYDYLVLAVGGETNFFGLDSVRRHGFALKDIPDALGISNHVLRNFELAVLAYAPDRRRALLTFVVVG